MVNEVEPGLPVREAANILQLAIECNDVKNVKKIVSHNPKLMNPSVYEDLDQPSPLWQAMMMGLDDIILVLLDHGADPNEKNDSPAHQCPCHTSMIHWIVIDHEFSPKKKQVAQSLIDHGANINCDDDVWQSVVCYSIMRGLLEWTDFLLQNGARLFDHNQCGLVSKYCPVYAAFAASCPNTMEMLQVLMKHGLKPGELGNTAGEPNLLVSLPRVGAEKYKDNNPEMVNMARFLLDSGVSPNDYVATEQDTLPTLHHFICYNNLDLIDLLIEKGADVNGLSKILKTVPLHIAAGIESVPIMNKLISAGANVNAPGFDGQAPLHLSCGLHNKISVDFLIKNGANIFQKTEDGFPPYFFLLDEDKFNYIHDECGLLIIKEWARLAFGNTSIDKSDFKFLKRSPLASKHFKKCTAELVRMSKNQLHKSFTYVDIMKKSFNINKLSAFLQSKGNKEKFKKFKNSLSYYGDNLEQLYKKAISRRNK